MMESEYISLVDRQVRRLRTQSLSAMERETAQRRLSWLEENRSLVPDIGSATPRDAFELFFFVYMGLEPEDLEIVSEDTDHIRWLSKNPCPTIDACNRLGLDTRTVCRKVYEKSTQAFLSFIDPELRFSRDYDRIRPYVDACLEEIRLIDFDAMMRIAIEEAGFSLREGNKGYGAVVVRGSEVLARTHDTASVMKDPVLHAEVNALRAAARHAGDADLCGAVLFSTCEPCPMCSSLAVWANVSAICYGASMEKTTALGRTRIHVPASEIIDRSPAMMEVIPGVMEEECLELYGR